MKNNPGVTFLGSFVATSAKLISKGGLVTGISWESSTKIDRKSGLGQKFPETYVGVVLQILLYDSLAKPMADRAFFCLIGAFNMRCSKVPRMLL